ncbi:MAG: 50S ribosomal protein L29 [Candidatus Tagabacteria bacterium CG_4_10_14_0_2_um_filter_40_13]|uniref:Large ribosomal subunit protein uL29 n=3 Tax=Candidatus Tagaibacteriota TaxID=1817918 RepID=A0A2M8G9L3_9BACT|nr:MAG: 50S ribosomal protein L29 [Candidatus Tagabacteria bacterium CG11_big_fil_rev_8_21_14_0_20_41_11]PIU99430.1 MAG: 50S ribosomal protein L29 [Candidatus Tagabacteria bacterium CG03_land_8_20_14_0_80_41_22]PIZ56089.1 MAG: 50S ribosomal protein L29 [Candidatus Tagabacteria bacterium CG_4_10_14_0_2_um_filter_40_13]PJC25429.1 MAG: 50S ribosomal protein L29 [Candidatus Tagabacteria bacterium CG_4_9_14_0_2_um_filter_41_11]PJC69940.1 MAG: 50S ribosomal protein L29 [Candidatus Tagabacteria bacter
MAKIKELREKTENERENFLKDKREALRRFRFQASHGKTKNTKEAREIRRDIARINTLSREAVKK